MLGTKAAELQQRSSLCETRLHLPCRKGAQNQEIPAPKGLENIAQALAWISFSIGVRPEGAAENHAPFMRISGPLP